MRKTQDSDSEHGELAGCRDWYLYRKRKPEIWRREVDRLSDC